ncbi:membrane progestin receptor gamma isoform X3 [Mustela erminea]|uniref:membrane progestin receptor gamma isoform X3 n=1 Tax=Mustela erminea TaxID=36723 RepID=UPI001387462A|nr:membrane progestin receptor gamma isoform X3 [Mustela erminea]
MSGTVRGSWDSGVSMAGPCCPGGGQTRCSGNSRAGRGKQPWHRLATRTPGHVGTLSRRRGATVHHRPSQPSSEMLSLKLPRLFSIDQVPQVFHEQGILFGYRHPQSSATACVLSLFQMTNETLNIWTHLLPFWFFVWRFVTALYITDIQNDSYSWPLFVYMGTSCVYPLVSSCAHTFSSMSKNARHICYFLDYGAVNLFSLGSAIAYSAYSLPDVMVCTTFHDYYVPLAVMNTILSTGLSCYSRFLEIQKPGLCKMLRILAFAYPYTWDSLPIFYRLFLLPGEGVQNEAILNHQKHMAMTLLASFFYSAHLPERLAPGRFDYIGGLRHPGNFKEERIPNKS